MRLHLITVLAAALALPSAAIAAPCVKPVTGAAPPRAQWSELEAYAATKALNSVIRDLQPIPIATGEINTDYYALTIDGQGQTAQALTSEIRSNFNEVVFKDADGQSVAPYDQANATLWNGANYKGAALSFVLATFASIPSETGAVVVTCVSPTDWVFSTVSTQNDGVHPVSGNRAFGVLANADGSLTIFTKATDRVVDQLPYSAVGGTVFSQGELVWRHLLDNLQARYQGRHPRNRTQLSLRRPYP